eukprot:TRINITY_DN14831_c0_g1_i1.p1 TRINITY_DN14831_c0_g1~~TRINITY_DN14831_c0_g1_i1.p1  ORF type:complete len:673 (+),score=187.86 TRINITY_DN14831_c0_g1_i1:149-2167(+)
MADNYGKGGKNRRKGGKKDQDYGMSYDGKGYGQPGKGGAMTPGPAPAGGKNNSSKDVVHHYPPKEMAADVGYPVRGGQTLLIAYFPWEASEADIAEQFGKFCRVKRVHLVVDKSSRKPRCFGFVKFLSKADAEEALRATAAGLVQLPDTRGHVWHLKAEWTKSGDMVVDDSEAEQEVAKRKEERRSRDPPPVSSGGKGASPPPKGALHPGVPAPLPPLQTRYPPQAALGMPPPPPAGMQQQSMAHGVPPLQQPVPPQGHLYGQAMYGQQGQQLYSSQAAQASALYGDVRAAAAPGSQVAGGGLDAPGLPSTAAAGAPPPLLRDIQGYASQQAYPGTGYAAAVAAAAAQQASGYPPAQSQSYMGQSYGSQPPYVSSQQAYSSSQYAGQQAAYAAGQQAYQTAAATATSAGPGYPGYPPQAQSAGYGAAPGYGAYGQQAATYPSNPATAYATAGYGLSGQSPYNYVQQPSATQGSGVVAYGNYPGAAQQSAAALPHQQQHAAMYPPADPRAQEAAAGQVAVAAMPPHVAHPAQQPAQQQVQQQPQSYQVQASTSDPTVATASLSSSQPAASSEQHQQQYLDMVWNTLPDDSLQKQPLPAPPAQQPPAPPAGHLPVPAGVSKEWENAPRPGAAGSAAVWNSFDDAAAKGMVDGLVGGDDTSAPPLVPPPPPAWSH